MSKPVTENLFSFSGRRHGKSYVLAQVMWIVVVAIMGVVADIIDRQISSGMFVALATLGIIPAVISTLAIGSQRCRDLGWTGWATLITLIPYVGGIFSLAIMIAPGTRGPNRYGPDPREQASVFADNSP